MSSATTGADGASMSRASCTALGRCTSPALLPAPARALKTDPCVSGQSAHAFIPGALASGTEPAALCVRPSAKCVCTEARPTDCLRSLSYRGVRSVAVRLIGRCTAVYPVALRCTAWIPRMKPTTAVLCVRMVQTASLETASSRPESEWRLTSGPCATALTVTAHGRLSLTPPASRASSQTRRMHPNRWRRVREKERGSERERKRGRGSCCQGWTSSHEGRGSLDRPREKQGVRQMPVARVNTTCVGPDCQR